MKDMGTHLREKFGTYLNPKRDETFLTASKKFNFYSHVFIR